MDNASSHSENTEATAHQEAMANVEEAKRVAGMIIDKAVEEAIRKIAPSLAEADILKVMQGVLHNYGTADSLADMEAFIENQKK